MSRVRRAGVACVSLAAMIALGWMPSQAQDSSSPGAAPPATPGARRGYDPARRVPPYFGQVNLTTDQKESIYKIRAKHQERIDALQRQLAESRASMLAECEAVLTDGQKRQLQDRRSAAKKGGASKPAPAADADKGSN